jgi:hypothetical protein
VSRATPRKAAAVPALSPAASTLLAERARLETVRAHQAARLERLYFRLVRAWNAHAKLTRLHRCYLRRIARIDAQLQEGR